MTKFKVGDAVECAVPYSKVMVGMTGTVIVVSKGTPPVLVKWDNWEGMGHDGDCGLPHNRYWVYPKNLKLAVFTLENE